MRRRVELALRAGLLLLAAAMVARGLPPGVRQWFAPRQLVETAFRLETGAVRAPAETAAPEIVLSEPTPTPSPAPAPQETAPAPDRTPEGLPILPTSFSGGLTLRNATDYAPDLPALLVELKYEKDANTAIEQIHRQKYPERLEHYRGKLILVGINYDRNLPNDKPGFKHHSCRIERG